MNRKSLIGSMCIAAVGAGVIASVAVAQDKTLPKDKQQHEMKLPPGMTEADMQACIAAGTPGKNHEFLTKQVGVWKGQCQMWMGPDMPPTTSECTSTITSIMDGRYIKCDWAGDMPGMGPFNGMGTTGYDNVAQQFVGTWIDNHSTGISQGTGELSSDGKTLTWEYTFNCPLTKKAKTMREVQKFTDDKTMNFEIFMNDPKSGKEYKMLSVDFKKQS